MSDTGEDASRHAERGEEKEEQPVKRQRREADPMFLAQAARRRWLAASSEEDLLAARALYQEWWTLQRSFRVDDATGRITFTPGNSSGQAASAAEIEIDPCELQLSQEKCILLLCQLGEDVEAGRMMRELGMVVRLSRSVLRYRQMKSTDGATVAEATPLSPAVAAAAAAGAEKNASALSAFGIPAKPPSAKPPPNFPGCVVDALLPTPVLHALQRALLPRGASYWVDHGYSDEPPSPFFSYLIPLANAASYGPLGFLAQSVFNTASAHFERAKGATFAEIWAHNRSHATGHQMHFDSDDEGRNGIRNPTLGSIFFLSDGACGGPTLVTDQRLGDRTLTPHGWLVAPKANRLTVFDGTRLHGVVPGRGVAPPQSPRGEDAGASCGRRVTVMCALWHRIEVREASGGPGAARLFPLRGDGAAQWVSELTGDVGSHEQATPCPSGGDAREVDGVVKLDTLWETPECKPWPCATHPIPSYDSVFQGF